MPQGSLRGHAVVAVAGNQAADAAHGISHGRRGAGNIQHGEHVHAVAPRDDQQRGNAGDEASKPGKAAAEPAQQRAKTLEGVGVQAVGRRIDDVPDLCAQNSGESATNGDDGIGSSCELAALDLAFKSEVSGGKRQRPSAGRRSEFPAAQYEYKEAVGSPRGMKDLRLSINGRPAVTQAWAAATVTSRTQRWRARPAAQAR